MIYKRALLVVLIFVFSLSFFACNKNADENSVSINDYDQMLEDIAANLNELQVLLSDTANFQANKQTLITGFNSLEQKVNDAMQKNISGNNKDIKNKMDECLKNLDEGAKNASQGINNDNKELLEKAGEAFKQGINSLNSFLNNNSDWGFLPG